LTFVGFSLVAGATASAIMLWPKLREAVVVGREAAALASPVPVAEPLFKLREGEIVTVRAERRGFSLVQTPAGRSGWVAGADLVRVLPQSGELCRPSH